MRTSPYIFYFASGAIGLSLIGPSPVGIVTSRAEDAPQASAPLDSRTKSLLDRLVSAHNVERAAANLPPLKSNLKLEQAALLHARDMAEHDRMSHEGSDHSNPAQRIERRNYPFQSIGENVAAGQTRVQEVMRGWMNSPEHKKNILGDFTEMGGAQAQAEDGRIYWCVDFGRPWPEIEPARAAADLVAAINRARAKSQLDPVTENPKLRAAASRHARAMAAKDKLGSKFENESSPFELAEKEGYRFKGIAEELASGQALSQDVVEGWTKGTEHRKTLLGDFADVGVGYAKTAKGKPYWCILFGKPSRSGSPDR